jgi:hypothetical protein
MISSSNLTLGTVGGYYLLENLFWADLTKFDKSMIKITKIESEVSCI